MENEQQPHQSHKTNWLIPISIILAGGLIAGALIYIQKDAGITGTPRIAVQGVTDDHPEENMRPIDATDHILGNPNAPVKIVEYSDTDCPYCQQFHPTLHRIVEEYGREGKVAWVYRHFAFHPNAPREAEAAECVAELGGNEKFWQFLDTLYEKKDFNVTPYKGLDAKELPKIAGDIGIDKLAFNSCMESGKYKQKIADGYNEAIKSGARGTPYTILVTNNGKVPIHNGAVPYDSLKSAIESLLNERPQ